MWICTKVFCESNCNSFPCQSQNSNIANEIASSKQTARTAHSICTSRSCSATIAACGKRIPLKRFKTLVAATREGQRIKPSQFDSSFVDGLLRPNARSNSTDH